MGFKNAVKRSFYKLPITNITPEGIIKRQLEVQAKGLTGNIRDIWEDLSDDSAWLGGKGESFERGPYYLDGIIPLGYLLSDDYFIDDAKKWIDSIIDSQTESGFFGPEWNTDWWPRMVVLKALVPYYHATLDERIIPFMDKFLECQYKNIDIRPPIYWAAARSLEAVEAIELVYEKTGKEYLIDLVKKQKQYMYDWFSYFDELPYKDVTGKYLSKLGFNIGKNIFVIIDEYKKRHNVPSPEKTASEIEKYNNSNSMKVSSLTHGVNIAMAIKYPTTYGMMTQQKEYYELAIKGYEQLMKHHGTANGLWTSDEHLSGANPSNGTELCTVVEMMYSLEEMLTISGDVRYADLLELLAFNALPATFTSDMCAHQYVQQVNQIAADKKKRQYYDANSEANIYGLEPNYGCCAANMHQGFPKFAANLCYSHSDGLAFMVYSSCTITSQLSSGESITIREETDYPFEDSIEFTVIDGKKVDTTLLFRIPEMTTGEIFYNGKSEGTSKPGVFKLKKKYSKGDKITLKLGIPITVITNPDNSISLRKGALLMALKIEDEYKSLRGEEPFNYRQFIPKSDWNLAPLLKKGQVQVVETINNAIPEKPFDINKPPVIIKVKGAKVSNWKVSKNSAGNYPKNPDISKEMDITLVPYGSTNIRIAQFPFIDK